MIRTERTVVFNNMPTRLVRVNRTQAERAVRNGIPVGWTLGQEFDPVRLDTFLPPFNRRYWYWVSAYNLRNGLSQHSS